MLPVCWSKTQECDADVKRTKIKIVFVKNFVKINEMAYAL